MKPQTLHCHTAFCDGKNTPEEMAAAALAAGCGAIGFSGHAPLDGEDWCMTARTVPAYRRAAGELREKYRGRMEVFAGLEQDFFSPPPEAGWDYLIGSVHCVKRGGVLLPVDESEEAFLHGVREHCGGDCYAFARDYFRMEAEVAEKTGCQIVGHFDLITKFNRGNRLFDTADPRYRGPAMEALDALLEQEVIFEINTGAMSRGYRAEPYPEPFLLRRIRERGGRVAVSSDSHSRDTLLFGYGPAFRLAADCGFDATVYRTGSGFADVPIADSLRQFAGK